MLQLFVQQMSLGFPLAMPAEKLWKPIWVSFYAFAVTQGAG